MRSWRSPILGVAGLAVGLVLATLVASCCSGDKRVTWEVLPGSYHIDNRLITDYAHDALAFDNLHGDTGYSLVVSSDGRHAVETFQRAGRNYQTTYDLVAGVDSPMRSDTNLSNEHLGD